MARQAQEAQALGFLPRGRRERVRQVDAAVAILEQQDGVRPSPERIAEHLGWGADEVDEVLASASAAVRTSLDVTDDEGSSGLASMLLDPRSGFTLNGGCCCCQGPGTRSRPMSACRNGANGSWAASR